MYTHGQQPAGKTVKQQERKLQQWDATGWLHARVTWLFL